jgi:hypothetical protein
MDLVIIVAKRLSNFSDDGVEKDLREGDKIIQIKYPNKVIRIHNTFYGNYDKIKLQNIKKRE